MLFHINDNLCIPCLVDIFLFLYLCKYFKIRHVYLYKINLVSSFRSDVP